jgi:hypothetical protein
MFISSLIQLPIAKRRCGKSTISSSRISIGQVWHYLGRSLGCRTQRRFNGFLKGDVVNPEQTGTYDPVRHENEHPNAQCGQNHSDNSPKDDSGRLWNEEWRAALPHLTRIRSATAYETKAELEGRCVSHKKARLYAVKRLAAFCLIVIFKAFIHSVVSLRLTRQK